MDILAINLLSGLLSAKNITRSVQLELVCLGNIVFIFTITMGLRRLKKTRLKKSILFLLMIFGQLESTSQSFMSFIDIHQPFLQLEKSCWESLFYSHHFKLLSFINVNSTSRSYDFKFLGHMTFYFWSWCTLFLADEPLSSALCSFQCWCSALSAHFMKLCSLWPKIKNGYRIGMYHWIIGVMLRYFFYSTEKFSRF